MVCVLILADVPKSVGNAGNRGEHRPSLGWAWGVQFVTVMKHRYFGKFDVIGNYRAGQIAVTLTGRLNEYGVLTPRSDT